MFDGRGGNHPTFVIAEAGVNHDGAIAKAFRLVDAAARAGADAVKFQTWKTENVVTRNSQKARYQRKTTSAGESQFEMLKRLELPFGDFLRLKKYCDRKKILFLSTADEIESAEFLVALQPLLKVGSAELTDLPYLAKLARFRKPLILSTGMGTLAEVRRAVATLEKNGLAKNQITALHCTTAYPARFEEVNLLAMVTMRRMLGVRVGYSDHTLGIEVPVAAVALGASVIEKHLTLDRRSKGPDHSASIEPPELFEMVRAIRNVERSLGDGLKRPTPAEKVNMPCVRKSIVARGPIQKGDVLNEGNLTVKRPGLGISPDRWREVVGKKAQRNFTKDDFISL
ncbi:MAG: N-acetylneuraminate synthase [Candidatus Omnitrophota bacterium]